MICVSFPRRSPWRRRPPGVWLGSLRIQLYRYRYRYVYIYIYIYIHIYVIYIYICIDLYIYICISPSPKGEDPKRGGSVKKKYVQVIFKASLDNNISLLSQ